MRLDESVTNLNPKREKLPKTTIFRTQERKRKSTHLIPRDRIQERADGLEEKVQQERQIHHDSPAKTLDIVVLYDVQKVPGVGDRWGCLDRSRAIVYKADHGFHVRWHEIYRALAVGLNVCIISVDRGCIRRGCQLCERRGRSMSV